MRQASQFCSTVLAVLILGSAPGCAGAQPGATEAERAARVQRLLSAPNPLAASESVWIEELTYLEVRDRIAAGATTAIISTGGVEENGPFLATGKHNIILEALCPAIATQLGNALCAPIVPFVPEGSLNPPSGAMHFPGSFTVRAQTFQALLEDIAGSLRQHGFKDIVLIGDSGGNQRGMQATAASLNTRWVGSGVRAHYVAEFYSPGWEATENYTEEQLGVAETTSDGHHDDIWVTAMMMVIDPQSVRFQQRLDTDLASINGVDISDLAKTIELGKKMIRFRAALTADAIRQVVER